MHFCGVWITFHLTFFSSIWFVSPSFPRIQFWICFDEETNPKHELIYSTHHSTFTYISWTIYDVACFWTRNTNFHLDNEITEIQSLRLMVFGLVFVEEEINEIHEKIYFNWINKRALRNHGMWEKITRNFLKSLGLDPLKIQVLSRCSLIFTSSSEISCSIDSVEWKICILLWSQCAFNMKPSKWLRFPHCLPILALKSFDYCKTSFVIVLKIVGNRRLANGEM